MRQDTNQATTKLSWTRLHFGSSLTFSLAVALAFIALFNWRFWHETIAVFWTGSVTDALFLASLGILLLFFYAALLSLIPSGRATRVVAMLLFLVGSVAAYSSDTLGILIDKEMIRNLVETDRREATALLNLRFLAYFLVLGVLPAVLTWRTRIASPGRRKELLHRAMFLVGGTVVSGLLVLAFASQYSSFAREHKSLRYLLVPGAAVQGAFQFARNSMPTTQDNAVADTDGIPHRLPASAKPILMFLVIGETARHQDFQLGGYERATNPELSRIDNLFYFRDVTSCGTSTAISLPCMFSHLSQAEFSVSKAQHNTNLLDALTKGGIEVEWRDNNSGSKGVSARVPTVSFDQRRNPALCDEEACRDEIMLEGLAGRLEKINDDAVIAFHQIGSHGPAYYKRYPDNAEVFKPACKTNELSRCTSEEIRNAYDNTIVYTDRVLAQQVAMLKTLSSRFDTVLIYVSDHGESLGEKGLYLHGAPYIIAPEEQKRVPFIVWMSQGYMARFGMSEQCLRGQTGKAFSHDNLYHTIIGAMGETNDLYQERMDVLASCRARN
jgi:lipid A ethanolaminephosphotransferase